MRTVNDHIINPANDWLVISATDEPGHGGANHRYEISGFDTTTNASLGALGRALSTGPERQTILFQNGPIAKFGVNGVTQEVLMAICIDRLRSFQKGPFACRENAIALTKLEESLMWLQRRTIERMRRGVEGTNQK